jgi:hypothetical protein
MAPCLRNLLPAVTRGLTPSERLQTGAAPGAIIQTGIGGSVAAYIYYTLFLTPPILQVAETCLNFPRRTEIFGLIAFDLPI